MYVGDKSPDEQGMFVAEKHCFTDLLEGLTSACPCGMTTKAWMLESVVQVTTFLNESHFANHTERPRTKSSLQL